MELGMMAVVSRMKGWLSSAVPRVETKNGMPVPLVALEARRRPRWSARNATAFAREGFAANPVGYRCVRMIAEAAASVPWLLFEGRREHGAHPLLDLIGCPNAHADGQSWSEALYGQLLVTGNAYAEAVAVKGTVRELHVLRSDRMKVVPGPDGWPDAYEYSVSGRSRALPAGRVERRRAHPSPAALRSRQRSLRSFALRARRRECRHPQRRRRPGTRRCSTTAPGPPARSSIADRRAART